MRFSIGKSGMFWTFLEPFFQVLVFVFIKVTLFGRLSDLFDYTVFLSLNFIAFNMFRHIVTNAMNSFTANKALFVYKQVKPIDTVIARALVELFLTSVIIVIFIFLGLYLGYDLSVKNLPMVVLAFLWLFIFSTFIGLLLAVGNTLYKSIGKIIKIMMTFLLFTSAVFYTIDMIPLNIREYLLLNPLVHFLEMLHGYFFDVLNDRYVDYEYIITITLFVMFISLILYKRVERKIISL